MQFWLLDAYWEQEERRQRFCRQLFLSKSKIWQSGLQDLLIVSLLATISYIKNKVGLERPVWRTSVLFCCSVNNNLNTK